MAVTGSCGSVLSTRAMLLQVSVQEAAKVVAHELQQELGDAKLPMAKLCSRVGGLATRVLDKNNNECMRRFADLKEVQSLSATVYCCGPPL